jgi:hypothetical protein
MGTIIAALKYKSYDDHHRKIIRTVVDKRFDAPGCVLGSEYPEDSEYLQTVESIKIIDNVVMIFPNVNPNVIICIPYKHVVMWVNYTLKTE